MSGHFQALAARREEAVTRTDRERAALGSALDDIERRFHLVEAGLASAQRMRRHRVVMGAVAVWSVLAPVAARAWIRRLGWWVPLAIEGYKLTRQFALARRSRSAEAPSQVEA